MGYADRLSELPSLGGWTHNPWGSPEAADAVATRIANRYIRAITQELLEMGFMPVTGTEVNFFTVGIDPKTAVKYIRGTTRDFRRDIVEKELRAALGPQWERLTTELKEIAAHISRTQDDKRTWQQERRARFQNCVEEYVLPQLLSLDFSALPPDSQRFHPQKIFDLNAYLKQYPDDPVIAELKTCLEKMQEMDEHWRTLFLQKQRKLRAVGALDTEKTMGGNVYLDQEEVEVATGTGSPAATVARVNAVKKAAWEIGDASERLWMEEEGADNDVPAPRSAIAQKMRQVLGSCDVYFKGRRLSCGEHINLSVWHTKDKDFHALPEMIAGTQTQNVNLMNHPWWETLFWTALHRYLAADTVLALGNERIFDMIGNHAPLYKDGGVPNQARLEIRSFNNASSNVSLTMLSILSALYAAVTTAREIPEFREKMEASHDQRWLYEPDADAILKRMEQKFSRGQEAPQTIEGALARFKSQSLTLNVMRELAEKHASQPPREGCPQLRTEDADVFRRAAVARLDRMKTRQRGEDMNSP